VCGQTAHAGATLTASQAHDRVDADPASTADLADPSAPIQRLFWAMWLTATLRQLGWPSFAENVEHHTDRVLRPLAG